MANFKSSSSSSGFVIGTTVLLLLIVINIHGAPACSNSSKVMLFNSSSLEVAKDQGITEFAIDHDHDHEIQRRVLQGGGIAKAGSTLTDIIGDIVKSIKPTPEEDTQLKNMFKTYCTKSCLTLGVNECTCSNRDSQGILKYVGAASRSCGTGLKVSYCCIEGYPCNFCCETPSLGSSSDSSGSPIVSVVMTIIAIFTTI